MRTAPFAICQVQTRICENSNFVTQSRPRHLWDALMDSDAANGAHMKVSNMTRIERQHKKKRPKQPQPRLRVSSVEFCVNTAVLGIFFASLFSAARSSLYFRKTCWIIDAGRRIRLTAMIVNPDPRERNRSSFAWRAKTFSIQYAEKRNSGSDRLTKDCSVSTSANRRKQEEANSRFSIQWIYSDKWICALLIKRREECENGMILLHNTVTTWCTYSVNTGLPRTIAAKPLSLFVAVRGARQVS